MPKLTCEVCALQKDAFLIRSLIGHLPPVFVATVLAFAITGCTIQGLPMSKKVHPEAASKLQVGITTMADVRAVFGSPSGIYTIQERKQYYRLIGFGEAARCWLFLYTGGSLTAAFDNDGKLVDYDHCTSADSKASKRKESDFSFNSAHDIIVGKTTKADVEKLLSAKHLVKTFNKAGVKERWVFCHWTTAGGYASSGVPQLTMTGPHSGYLTTPIADTDSGYYQRQVAIDFDEVGTVVGMNGESNFPGDD